MKKIIIVGGGAAGMMAALTAAVNDNEIIIIEKNEKLGKKLFITGKGRCNVTNSCDLDQLFSNIMTNPKFMYSAFKSFDNRKLMDFFEEGGLRLKTERGGRVFPASDRSSDVIKNLESRLKAAGVRIMLNTRVRSLITEDGCFKGVVCQGTADKKMKELCADALIIATGGISYPSCGACPDGYELAGSIGHKIVSPLQGLVPFNIKGNECREMMGLTLKNVSVYVKKGDKKLCEEFGEMLFTHFGISGPVVLTLSMKLDRELLNDNMGLTAGIDLKPALDEETLDKRLIREFEKSPNRQLSNVCESLMPKALVPVCLSHAGLDGEQPVNGIDKKKRRKLLRTIKGLEFELVSLRGFSEAIITRGGINVKEINPKTMESRLCKNIYFAGEVMDVDALTGGFNLQIAWSSGMAAGKAAGEV